ncbi:DNA-directed RNA polymerase II subunit RPB1-like X4 [Biomphalaria glabrata]|nr:Biomphalaria glabrata DNA-directed RNA polymerase II subunit RPB1-like; transcript variant X4 [Biomphalaria glabrata]
MNYICGRVLTIINALMESDFAGTGPVTVYSSTSCLPTKNLRWTLRRIRLSMLVDLTTGYPYNYESTTYNPYSTNDPWHEASTYSLYTTGNPYYNPYTPVASAFPSKDCVASLVQQVIQQMNSE